ncbi:MAG: urate hydroxylase PuuD [Gemmatimonadales bacterium]
MAEFLLRWFHYLGGITWIGLLYYFNFVQGPFMAEADPAAKSTATQKLLPRALRWFRGGAILTFFTGIAILGQRFGESPLGSGAWSTPWAITILTGGLFGTLMFLNVVLVIWPKQRVVIASATAVASGGQANAAAPAAARRAFLASRTNVVFSIPMLFFMGAASHFTVPAGGNHTAYWASVIVLAALLEINCLTATVGATTKPIEKIPGVIITGFVVWAITYGLVRALLSA